MFSFNKMNKRHQQRDVVYRNTEFFSDGDVDHFHIGCDFHIKQIIQVVDCFGFVFTLVGIGNIVDVYVLGQGGVLRTAVIFFYLSNEGVSILENSAHLGLPIPEKLKEVLEQLHDREGKNDESA